MMVAWPRRERWRRKGKIEMAEQVYKTGRVRLGKFDGCRKWEVRYGDRATGKYVRRRLDITSKKEARAYADALNSRLASGEAAEPEPSRSGPITVRDAVASYIKNCSGGEETKADYVSSFNAFVKWLSGRRLRVRYWQDLDGALLMDYARHCQRKNLAHDTVKYRLGILRMTSRHMAFMHGTRDIAAGMRLKRAASAAGPRDRSSEILTAGQLRKLLSLLRERDPLLHAWVALGGLTGMRVKEYLALRKCDVDLEAGTVTVTKNEAHTPKTPASYRTIPVAPYVLDTIRPFIKTDMKLNAHGFIFVSPRQYTKRAKAKAALLGCYTPNGTRNRFLRRLRELEAEDAFTAPTGFMPRKLRATFISAVGDLNAEANLDAEGNALRFYVGQKPTSVLTAHYDVPSIERLGKIAGLAQGMVGDGA